MTRPEATGQPPGQPDLPATLAARPGDAPRGLPAPPGNEHPDATGDRWQVDPSTINTTGHGITAHLPAPFHTVHAYAYGPHGRQQPATGTR